MSAAGRGLLCQPKETKQKVIKHVNLPTVLKPTDIKMQESGQKGTRDQTNKQRVQGDRKNFQFTYQIK